MNRYMIGAVVLLMACGGIARADDATLEQHYKAFLEAREQATAAEAERLREALPGMFDAIRATHRADHDSGLARREAVQAARQRWEDAKERLERLEAREELVTPTISPMSAGVGEIGTLRHTFTRQPARTTGRAPLVRADSAEAQRMAYERQLQRQVRPVRARPHVFAIIDEHNALIVYRHERNDIGDPVWFTGIPTDGLSVGEVFGRKSGEERIPFEDETAFRCLGERSYETMMGNRSVKVFAPVDLDELAERFESDRQADSNR